MCRRTHGSLQSPSYKLPTLMLRRSCSLLRLYVERYFGLQSCGWQATLTLLDYIRCQPNTSRCASFSSKSVAGILEGICSWSKTDPHPALCLLSHPGNPNDRMEGCSTNGGFNIGKLPRKPRCHIGFLESSSRGSHRRAQNHFDSMWAEIHHPANIHIDVWVKRDWKTRI